MSTNTNTYCISKSKESIEGKLHIRLSFEAVVPNSCALKLNDLDYYINTIEEKLLDWVEKEESQEGA